MKKLGFIAPFDWGGFYLLPLLAIDYAYDDRGQRCGMMLLCGWMCWCAGILIEDEK